jgi:hypothetical protein
MTERRPSAIVDFDFERRAFRWQGLSEGVRRTLQGGCDLTITRDLRSESCVHLRSLLTAIPKSIRDDMADRKQMDDTGERADFRRGQS